MINLNSRINRVSTNRNKGGFFKFSLRIIIFLVILAALTIIPLKLVYGDFKEVQNHSKALASAYQNQNFGQIQSETTNIKNSLKKSDFELNFLIWLRIIPFFGGYYSDAKNLTSAGVNELEAFEVILKDLKPFEEELGFLGKPLAGQDRITQALNVLNKALPTLEKVEPDLKKGRKKVEGMDTGKYPETVNGLALRNTLETFKNFIVGLDVAVTDARSALEVTPTALGVTSTKNYLILFQNDKELRATGGFLTAYAFLKVNKGQIDASVSDDIYRLDERLLGTCETKICPLAPPAPIIKYLPEVDGKPRKAWSMRDSNLSPDVPTSAKEFERMFNLLGQGLPFDGIIFIDSQVVENLIEVTGEINVAGTPYSSKIDHRCNCPNVIYELESYAEVAAKGSQDRKAILGVLMQQILAKLVGSDVNKIPFALETIVELANHKHIMFFMHDQTTQDALSKLNWTGEVKSFDGDYLSINDSNFAGGKSNIYLEEKVLQEIKISGDKVTKKITIDYKNPQGFNTWLNGINRSYVRFYVPKGSKLVNSKGSDDPVNTSEELGKTVFEAFVVTRPQNSRKLEIEYEIPYQSKGDYKLMVQKQPGTKDFDYVVKLNGSQKAGFKLDADREFKFGI